MKRDKGFTLVELLVVIAIIAILAAIVVPQVTKYISRAKMAKAVAEVNSIQMALTEMLNHAERRDFSQMVSSDALSLLRSDREYASRKLYEMMRQGRNADIAFAPGVREKLGTSYLDIPLDPWDQRYQFFPGQWPSGEDILLRCHRMGLGDRADPGYVPYIYNEEARFTEEQKRPGNPRADGLRGFPAPKDLPFYVWSRGSNMFDDQDAYWATDSEYNDGGDDINNWDVQSGWASFYN